MSNKFGKITQVIGAVVDVQFESQIPEILTALECDNSGSKLVLEPDSNVNLNDITDIFLINKGNGYVSLPSVSITTSGGTNGNVLAYGTEIGRVIGLKTNELGEGYQNSPSPTMKVPLYGVQITALLFKLVPAIIVPSLFIPNGNVISDKVIKS